MSAGLRWLWFRLNANYWFYPAIFAVIGASLAIGLVAIDRSGGPTDAIAALFIEPARPQSASVMLQVIATSMIGVASTVFSITIAAVAYASGTYGPRLLNNFMEDRGNQLSLATFIGTFVYAITVLRTIRAEDETTSAVALAADDALPGFVPQISLLVAYLLMGLSVAVLVYFLNHIPSSIRINTVLEGIAKRLLRDIDEAFPAPYEGKAIPRGTTHGAEICAKAAGYIEVIDFDGLCDLARKHGCCITLRVRTGEFVHPGVVVASIAPPPERPLDLDDCYSLSAARTAEQNPQFLIDELIEIGLRALSPGINDPFTAITALHWLGAAMAKLGARDLDMMQSYQMRRGGHRDPDAGKPVVFPLRDDFDHYLIRGFGTIRSAVATSHAAALIMFDTLRNTAAAIGDDARRLLLRRQGDLLMEQIRVEMAGADLGDLEARYLSFGRAMDQLPPAR